MLLYLHMLLLLYTRISIGRYVEFQYLVWVYVQFKQ
jgi:hypothetical protein